MELLMWVEQVYVWRLQREHGTPKQEVVKQSEDERRQGDDQMDQGSMVAAHAHTTHQD